MGRTFSAVPYTYLKRGVYYFVKLAVPASVSLFVGCQTMQLDQTASEIDFKAYCSSSELIETSIRSMSARVSEKNSKGICAKDRKGESYHSGRAPRAKFYDRAQVAITNFSLKPGITYRVKAKVKLSGSNGKGSSWAHQNGTTFFSIGDKTYSTIWTNHGSLTSSPKHAPEYITPVSDLIDRWVTMEWSFKIRQGVFVVNYLIDGENQRNHKYELPVSHPIWDGKDALKLRLGLHRPGTKSNSLQSITYKDIQVLVEP